MANQKAIINLWRNPQLRGPPARGLRVVLVDSDGGAATFTDIGAATTWIADGDYWVGDCVGQGTTAPATATSFQFGANGNQLQAFINGAGAFDPKSTAPQRLPGAFAKRVPQGTNLTITGRA